MRLLELWHGTNQVFDRFDASLLGLNTYTETARRAFFLSADRATAADYAEYAARNLIRNHVAHENRVADLNTRAVRAAARGKFDEYERLIEEMERIEAEAVRAEPADAAVLLCRVRISNPREMDMGGAGLVSGMDLLLDQARATGHDVVILRNIRDTPSGIGPVDDHYAIFDPENIEILERQPLEDHVPAMSA